MSRAAAASVPAGRTGRRRRGQSMREVLAGRGRRGRGCGCLVVVGKKQRSAVLEMCVGTRGGCTLTHFLCSVSHRRVLEQVPPLRLEVLGPVGRETELVLLLLLLLLL